MSEVTTTTEVPQDNSASIDPAKIESKPNEINTETKAPEKPKEYASDSFAALARKEKSIVKARQEIAAQKAEFEREKASAAKEREEFTRWKQLKDNAKLDPDAYLSEAGLSYGSLTERNLKGGVDPNAILEKTTQKLSEFEKKLQEKEEKAAEEQKTRAQQDYETNVKKFVEGIYDFVEQDKENFELIKLNNQQNLIWEVIQAGYSRGQELTVKQAAEKVETYMTEQIEKALSAKKFQGKYSKVVKEEEPVKPGSPTLTNNATSTTPSTKARMLTEQERIANAMAVLNKFDT